MRSHPRATRSDWGGLGQHTVDVPPEGKLYRRHPGDSPGGGVQASLFNQCSRRWVRTSGASLSLLLSIFVCHGCIPLQCRSPTPSLSAMNRPGGCVVICVAHGHFLEPFHTDHTNPHLTWIRFGLCSQDNLGTHCMCEQPMPRWWLRSCCL